MSITLLVCVKTESPHDPAIPLLGINPDKTIIQKDRGSPMFISAPFTTAKTWKQSKCPPTNVWTKSMWYINTMEYYSAIKKSEIMPSAATWMGLGSVMPSEVSQRRGNTIRHLL